VKTFGDSQLDWLKRFGSFENGIPSADTLGRVFSALCPEKFTSCFIDWIESVRKKHKGEIVAVDGKCIKGADPTKDKKGMPHIVSAFASENGLCLGQATVDQKSNEITAIPLLLELIAIEGCTVTIDAMGCQSDIAGKIIENGADYILAVKGNQQGLEQSIRETVMLETPDATDTEEDCGHNRLEKRTCTVYTELSHIEKREKWPGLRSLVRIESEVYDKKTGKTVNEERLYITSCEPDAVYINNAVRKHWNIENNLHWSLDVQFGEDASRKRKGRQAENFNILLKIAMTMLVKDTKTKISKPRKRMKAALDQKYRQKLLNF